MAPCRSAPREHVRDGLRRRESRPLVSNLHHDCEPRQGHTAKLPWRMVSVCTGGLRNPAATDRSWNSCTAQVVEFEWLGS